MALKDSIVLRMLMLEYILLSDNFCKHRKTVINKLIKFAKVKASLKFTLVFMIVFARTVKIMKNGFYSSLICSHVLELLRFM